jgi:F-type H+-transporting ATPase subunit b
MATSLAGKIIGESLEDDDRQHRTIERFIADLESQSAGQSS